MIQAVVLGFIALGVLIFLLKIEKIQKLHFQIFLAITILFSFLFAYIEYQNGIYRDEIHKVILKYNRDENLSCGNYLINRKSFNLTSNSFIDKNGTYGGMIVPVEECFSK